MLSKRIVVAQPYIPQVWQPQTKRENTSNIKTQADLDEFLKNKPGVGDVVHNKNYQQKNIGSLRVIAAVKTKLDECDISHTGFPETHTVVFLNAIDTFKPWVNTVDIRDYESLSSEEMKKYIDDKLQDRIETYLESRQSQA